MKLTLRQRNYRQFTVLFEKKTSHTFHLPGDRDLAREFIWKILDETGPTQNPQLFYAAMMDSLQALGRGVDCNKPTSFFCGDVCLTLE